MQEARVLVELLAARDLPRVELLPFGVAVGVEVPLALVLGLGADARRVHLNAEGAPAAGPRVDEHARGVIIEVKRGQDEVDVRGADPPGDAIDVYHLAAAHPAERVDGMDAVIHHVVPRAHVWFGRALVELADRVGDRPAPEALVAKVNDHRARPALEADLGDDALLLGEVSHHLGLVGGQAHRLLDVEIQPLLQAPHPDVDHDVRLADGVDGVGGELIDHRPVVGITAVDTVLVGGRREAGLVEVADAGNLDIIEGRQRRVMDGVGHPPGADHRDTDLLGLAWSALRLAGLGHVCLRGDGVGWED